jgi:hypothetical protein
MRQPAFIDDQAATGPVCSGRVEAQQLRPAPSELQPVRMRPELCQFLPGFQLVQTCTPGELVCTRFIEPFCRTNPWTKLEQCFPGGCAEWTPTPGQCRLECVRVGATIQAR